MKRIEQIHTDKKRFLELLLLADEQESMIDLYLEKGEMFVLFEDEAVAAECVVTDNGGGIFELKNIAVLPKKQGKGYAKALVEFLFQHYRGKFSEMHVGTGDCPPILHFYEKLGFHVSYRVKNFFTDNYDHPIFDCGKQLVDMVYLVRKA